MKNPPFPIFPQCLAGNVQLSRPLIGLFMHTGTLDIISISRAISVPKQFITLTMHIQWILLLPSICICLVPRPYFDSILLIRTGCRLPSGLGDCRRANEALEKGARLESKQTAGEASVVQLFQLQQSANLGEGHGDRGQELLLLLLLRRLIAMCDRLNLSALSVSAEPRLAFECRGLALGLGGAGVGNQTGNGNGD